MKAKTQNPPVKTLRKAMLDLELSDQQRTDAARHARNLEKLAAL